MTVSREWQSFLEPFNFAKITLSVPRLTDSESQVILFKRQDQIRYIWFRVELQQYDCTVCANQDTEILGLSDANNSFVADAFKSLFLVLTKWEPRGDLTLDITIYSPSDDKHCFKYLRFYSDVGSEYIDFSPPLTDSNGLGLVNDPEHGWTSGRQLHTPNVYAIERTFQEMMGEGPFDDEEPEMEWWRNLPSIPVVGTVLLRQQTRRRWNPVALANMFTRFPNLQELIYEPWREFSEIQFQTDRRK
jgi:hypothetical protein